MLKGKKIKKGDTIGIVAPAGNAEKKNILKATKILKELGYNVVLSKNIFDSWFSFAGKDKNRISEINDFFGNPNIDVILCLRGGYGSIRIIEELDIELIKENPKIFIGYSDISTLHTKLNKEAELITFHGPMLTSNFLDMDEFTLNSFFNMIGDPTINTIENPLPMKVLNSGKAKGRMVGGNLITLMGDMGTPNELNLENNILFIEEIGEPTYKIDRALSQLLNSKKLNKVNGIILGDFNDCKPKEKTDISLLELFKERFLSLNVPVLYGLKSGHCKPMVTIPLGVEVELNCNSQLPTIKILEEVIA